jgi:hypothetical protein
MNVHAQQSYVSRGRPQHLQHRRAAQLVAGETTKQARTPAVANPSLNSYYDYSYLQFGLISLELPEEPFVGADNVSFFSDVL